jgi:ubiquinone/menaquinone biosynthesis C-methylase UbiE
MQGDVGNLKFSNETFDIVLSMNGFHAFPDKEKAFSETARVIKKGGITWENGKREKHAV